MGESGVNILAETKSGYGTHPWNSKYSQSEDEWKFQVLRGQTTRVWGDPAPKAKPPRFAGESSAPAFLLHVQYHVPERNSAAVCITHMLASTCPISSKC